MIKKIIFSVSLLFLPLTTWAVQRFNMPKGVTPVSESIYHLHMTIFWICVVIAVAVFVVMLFALIFHRKSRGVKPAEFHEHPVVEILWTIIPFVILIVMAIPATKVFMKMDDTAESDVTIKITGYQWKWQYQYLDEGINFFSNMSTPWSQIKNNEEKKNPWYLLEVDNPVVVPVGKKIRFLVTSNDVIHSWWVPEFGIKRDAIPGFVYEAWAKIKKPGTYRGQCTELCGVHHAYMPIVVEAVSEEAYAEWVAKKKQAQQAALSAKDYSKEELMTLGKKTYDAACAACHKVDGTGMPPVFPAMKASSVAVGDPISRHIEIVLHGVPGTAMQAFAEQLTDAEIAAVTTYERNAWGNNTGDVVQPKDIRKLRKK